MKQPPHPGGVKRLALGFGLVLPVLALSHSCPVSLLVHLPCPSILYRDLFLASALAMRVDLLT